MTRRPLIGANWKLHLGPQASATLAEALDEALTAVKGADLVIFPTALSAPAVVNALVESPIAVGVQWVSPYESGAYTGANSAFTARELGCTWALTGHSEVRAEFAETDERVHGAVRATLAAGLLPMMCLGETSEDRDAGRVEEVLHRQLQVGLGQLLPDEAATVTIAYEPVWAIGTGRNATPEQAQEAHASIRAWLRNRYPSFVADQVRILYGGSVKPHNAQDIVCQPDVDGALVGGASLDVEQLTAIVRAAAMG